VPYFDRLDYVAPMNQEHAFALAVERLLGIEVPRRGQLIRVLYAEIGRLLAHLMNVTTQAMDIGALTPPLWGFEQREKLMVFYERASGARMHAAYFRPGGVHQDLPQALIDDIGSSATSSPRRCDDIDTLLTDNRIFKQRNVDIGVVPLEEAWGRGFSGVMVRGSGAPGTCARRSPTSAMLRWISTSRSARTATATTATCIRMEEMRQANKIMKQCVEKLNAPDGKGPVSSVDGKVVPPKRGEMKQSMEALIHHFKLYTEGFKVPAGESLRRRRSAQGRVRRLSRVRRHQQALSLQDPRSGLRPSPAPWTGCAAAHAGRRHRDPRAPSISCSERLTADERASPCRRVGSAGKFRL
jgi:NADH-quinone oxidoreductase subunit D